MKLKNLLLAGLFGIVLYGTGCNIVPEKPETDPEDYLSPEITLTNPGIVEFGSCPAYNALDTIMVEADLYDNKGLAEYIITLTYAPENYYLKTNADPMDVTRIGPLEGKNLSFSKAIPVDWDVSSGPYQLTLEVIDVNENSTTVTTCVQLQNGPDKDYPSFIMITPSTASVGTYRIGEYIQIKGAANDNVGITDAVFRVRNTYTKELLMGSEIVYPAIGSTSFSFDTSIYIPPTVPGDYDVELYVRDSAQNLGYLPIPVNIETN